MNCYFFGTFDPVHIGHIKIAKSVKKEFNFERVIFVPTPAPPHKNAYGASFFDRVEMLKLAVGEENVNDIENTIEPPNYTYKTIEKLDNIDNGARTGSPLGAFIIGFDQFEKIEEWKNPEYLKKMLEFIVIPRNITDATRLAPDTSFNFAHLAKKGYTFKVADFERIDISSSEIRAAVKNGENISNLVDKKVENYIYEQRLYC